MIPSRRLPIISDQLALLVLALLLNCMVAILIKQPGYADAYYYYNGGLRLLEGFGFTDAYIWNYLNVSPILPAPSHTYWQPLPSILAWLGMRIFGATFGAAQLPFILIASLLPLVTYTVALELDAGRRRAWIAALFTIFSGFYVAFWPIPESLALYALTASLALLLTARARQSAKAWQWLAVGILSALGHLSRPDGPLVLIVAIIVILWPGHKRRSPILPILLLIIGYTLAMSPWFARNLAALGSPLPTGGLDALFLVEYNDLFLFDRQPDLPTYLASGLPAILKGKGSALLRNLGTFVAVHNLIFLTPFTIIGSWRRRKSPFVAPSLLYGLALYAAMTFAFTFSGPRGSLFHSGGALLPFIFPVAMLGLDDAVAWVACRRRTWNRLQADRIFGATFVFFAVVLTGFVIVTRIIGPGSAGIAWNQRDAVYDEIGAYLEKNADPDALVMVNDISGFYYHTGRGGIPIPNGDEATLIAAARAYGIAYIIVDHNVVLSLQSLYDDGPQSDTLQLLNDGPFRPDDPVYLYRLISD